MPWVGGINTAADPGVISSQELVQADNVVFSSSGARIKREALEYLDNEIPAPDFRSSSGTTRTLKWITAPLVNSVTPNERLVLGEHITISGNINYNADDVAITSLNAFTEVVDITTVADVAGSLNNKYFYLSAGDEGTNYYVWFNVNGAGVDPEIPLKSGIAVAVATGASAATVATALQVALDAELDFIATVLSNVVTVTMANAGYTIDPTAQTSGFTVSVTTQGGHSITYEDEDIFNEAITAAAGVDLERSSKVLNSTDYWRFSDDATNAQLLVYATADFQMFTLDDSGRRVQVHGQEQTTEVTTTAASTLTTGDHFLLNGPSNEINYYVWYNKDAAGGDPMVSGRVGIPVAIITGDTAAQVATKTAAAVTAEADFNATALSTAVTIVAARAGITDISVDNTTGFVITTTAYGATAPGTELSTIRSLIFNERLQMYFSGRGNYPIKYNPDDSAKYQLIVPNGANGLEMPDASFAFIHLGRIWANDKDRRDLIHYSETFDETLWLGLGDSGGILIYPGDGDPQGITNGYVYKGFAVIGKQSARYRVLGDSPENFQVEAISSGMGNEGPFSVAVDETDVYFISKRGIHSQLATDTYGDTDAIYLSSNIKGSFNDFEPANLKIMQGAYIPELNSVAFSVTEDGEQTPNDVWLYNFEVQVPDRNPGAWYRWPGISCTSLGRRFTNNKYKLIFGTKNGRVIQAQKENDYTDFGNTGIPFTLKSGTIYPGNDPQTMKAFKRITMIYRPKGNFSFAVLAKIDNHEQQGFAFNEISGLDLLGETFILGVSILGSSNTLAPYTFTMEGYGRGVTLTIQQPTADEQVEIWGFVIEWENADLEQEVQ